LTGIESSRGHREIALKEILDLAVDADFTDVDADDISAIAEEVYLQIHSRFILTPAGLQAMV
jgi:hypothetical protein